MIALEQDLADVLADIEANDTNYDARYPLVWEAMGIAARLGFRVGVKIDPAEPNWPVIYIDLPTGQVSWHMPEYPGEWDGHTTEEKYTRTRDYIVSELHG